MLELNKIYQKCCIQGIQEIKNNSINLIIADPPYGISKKKPLKGSSKGKIVTLNESWDDFDSKSELITFYRSWIEEAYRVMKDNACICIWGDRRNIFYVQPILEEYFPKFIDMVTWVKRDAPPNVTNRGMSASTEFCLIYCKSDKNWIFNAKEIKKYNNGKQLRNCWDIPRSMKKEERLPHPTQKKIETQLILVNMLSNKGDLVLDPFMGSGTTAEACVSLDRNYIGFEKNKIYYDMSQKRLENLKIKRR